MVAPSERIVNLALFIAGAREPVSAEQVRSSVAGYSPDQDAAAFARMFERDKDELRRAGLVIAVDRDGGAERYRVDTDATYAGHLTLDPREMIELRAAGAAALADPAFPYADDLRFAMAKLMAASDSPGICPAPLLGALTADERPEAQAQAVAALTTAATSRKRATFSYADASGRRTERTVEPWGLFAREGRWYLVAWDSDADGTRVFAVARIRRLAVNDAKLKTPDFVRPADFDVRPWMLMPFQYGPRRATAVLEFSGAAARRAEALAAGQGELEAGPGGTVVWTVPVADEGLLARWAVEQGPGIRVLEPASCRAFLSEGLREVIARHG